MNRHELVSLAWIVAALAVVVITSAVLVGAFFMPTATRDVVGDVGILVASLLWFAWAFGAIVFRERILAWMERRRALRDSP